METQGGVSRSTEVGSPWVVRSPKQKDARKLSQGISSPVKVDRVSRFIQKNPQLPTPFLVVDLETIARNYRAMRSALPATQVFYAVKANPARAVVKLLADLGSSFDVASPAEVELVMREGVSPDRISFGNTIKKERDIAWAYGKGVRLFAFDSEAELLKLARSAPGSRVFCRILMTCEGAEWPLSRKFGCEIDMAHELLRRASALGLEAYGVSFHVGSQQTRIDQWDAALAQTAHLFSRLEKDGIELKMVNIGGGLPARYREPVSPMQSYADAIIHAMVRHFGRKIPDVIIEPGRSLVGDSGIIETEVVLISKKAHDEEARWVYLDIGKFGGLAETHDEAIKYRIEAPGRRGATGPVILAGPSCDSVDILYEKFQYHLPLSLKVGDRLRIHSTGAYTSSYSSVGFNGFPPLTTHCI